MTPFFNLPRGPRGHSVRHGKTRSPKADLTTLLEMRRETQVHHEHARLSDRANVSHVRLPVRQQNFDFREGVGRLSARGPLPRSGLGGHLALDAARLANVAPAAAHPFRLLPLIGCQVPQRALLSTHPRSRTSKKPPHRSHFRKRLRSSRGGPPVCLPMILPRAIGSSIGMILGIIRPPDRA
jgi:hypothetical protein